MLACAVMCVCLAATALLWRTGMQAAHEDLRMEFDFRAREAAERIDQRLRVYAQVLRGAQGMLSVSGMPDRSKFSAYAKALRIEENYPGIQGIGIALVIPPGSRASHIQAMRRLGFHSYTVLPEGERETLTSIVQLEPFSGRNLRAFGFDMFSEPVRRTAMERARDTDTPSISGKVRLMQETERDGQNGFLMYLPIYQDGAAPVSLQARRADIVGWVYMPFRMNDLMTKIGGERGYDIGFEVYDGSDTTADALMYDSDTEPLSIRSDIPLFKSVQRLDVAGHSWTVAIYSRPGLETRGHDGKPSAIAVLGVALSLLLSMLTWLLASGRARALALAARMTREFKESEQVLKFAIEGSGDGIWDWNVDSGQVHFSRRWKEMLGYADKEIADHVDEWKTRIHPDDLTPTMSDLETYFRGESDIYASEHRLRCKDGGWKWILDRGTVVSRTADGRPLRMVGTHTDITLQRQADERERVLKNVYTALSEINEAIMHRKRESDLFSDLCRIAVEYGCLPLAWVGIPEADGRLEPVASHGGIRDFLDGLFVTVKPGTPEGEGPAGQAYRKGHPVVFDNIEQDALVAPWRAKGMQYGLTAGAAFPIRRADRSYAVLVVYSSRVGAFNAEIVQLLERMAGNVSFALNNLDREAARRRREDEIRVLFENASDGIFIADRNGRYLDVNRRGALMMGYEKQEVLERRIADLVAPHQCARIPGELAEMGDSSQVSEWLFERKDGSAFPGEVSAQLLPDGRIIGIVRDITVRKQAEEELKLAAMVFRSAGEAMTVTDADANIIAVNPAFTRLTGYAQEEAIGRNPRFLQSGRHDEPFYRQMWESITAVGGWQGEIWNRRKDGSIYPERLSINTVHNDDGTVKRYVAMFQDITQEKQAEETIRALSANHIEVREQEGKRIAREIHDDLGQRLTLLRMDLLTLPKTLGASLPDEAMLRMRTSIDDCIRIARNIVAELRPAVLDIGIVPAIEWLLDDFEARTGIDCLFHNLIDGELILNEQQATGIFRIVQESLANVAKHARATQVEVNFETDDGCLCVKIADNGVGFEPEQPVRRDAYGLTGMRERAAMLGGRLGISARPGNGVQLQVRIPLAAPITTIS